MENIYFNPKRSEIEDSKSISESFEKKLLNIEGVGDFEYKERYIEFPEYLIEETQGVKGYIRKEVEWKSLSNALNQIISFEELNELIAVCDDVLSWWTRYHDLREIADPESLDGFQQILAPLNWIFEKEIIKSSFGQDAKNFEEREEFKERLGEERFKRYEDIIPKVSSFTQKVVDVLGNNFLEKSNIHMMNGVWGLDKTDTCKFENKMILQRIFSPDLESVHEKGVNAFSTETFDQIKTNELPNDIFDKEDGSGKRRADGMSQKFREHAVAIVIGSGLSVSNKGFWSCDGDRSEVKSFSKPFFGFSNENIAYVNYLKSTITFFERTLERVQKYTGNRVNPINSTYFMLDKYIEGAKDLLESGKSRISDTENAHPIIPIIIGHPQIPDLRWCHASHAYIPTKNGISVLEFISKTDADVSIQS